MAEPSHAHQGVAVEKKGLQDQRNYRLGTATSRFTLDAMMNLFFTSCHQQLQESPRVSNTSISYSLRCYRRRGGYGRKSQKPKRRGTLTVS